MSNREFRRDASRRAEAMSKSRRRRNLFWAGLGMVGSVGWMIALPTVGGAFLGRFLDQHFGTNLTFTLLLLMLGLGLGGYSVWRLFSRDTS